MSASEQGGILEAVGTTRDRNAPGLNPTDPSAVEDITDEVLPFVDGLAAPDETEERAAAGGGGDWQDLASAPAPAILHELYVRAASGGLLLAHGKVKKVVYLRDGYPVAVKSNVVGECLGKILTWEGLITEEQYRRSLQSMRESGVRQGSALIRMGALTHQQLARGLELQLRFKICETFSWAEGSHWFFPEVDPPHESVPMSISPAALLHEGIRTFLPQPALLAALRPHADRYLCPTEDPLLRFQDIGPNAATEEVLALVDGRVTLAELMRRSPLAVRETAALAHALLVAGVVEPRSEPSASPERLHTPEARTGPREDRSRAGCSAQRVDLARLVSRLRASDPRDILGVRPGAPDLEVRHAFFQRALERHPDRVGASAGAGIRALAATALSLTAEAYASLSGQAIRGGLRQGGGSLCRGRHRRAGPEHRGGGGIPPGGPRPPRPRSRRGSEGHAPARSRDLQRRRRLPRIPRVGPLPGGPRPSRGERGPPAPSTRRSGEARAWCAPTSAGATSSGSSSERGRPRGPSRRPSGATRTTRRPRASSGESARTPFPARGEGLEGPSRPEDGRPPRRLHRATRWRTSV